MRPPWAIVLLLVTALPWAGPGWADERLEATVVNMGLEEISFRLVDEVCGELLFEGRLQGNGQRVVHLCPTAVGKGDMSVHRLDGARDQRFRHVPPNGKVMLR